MDFTHSPRARDLLQRLRAFMDQHIYPHEEAYRAHATSANRWETFPLLDALKEKAKGEGLWNLFLTHSPRGPGLTNVEYAVLAEEMGRVNWSAEVFNCSAPDTGNMEVLDRYGSPEQQERWLVPLLKGEIRSAFAMTEPDVASSDATNIAATIQRDGDEWLLNGRKWWVTNAGNPRCRLILFLGRSNTDGPRHAQHSIVLVPVPATGYEVVRSLTVFDYDDAPHGHMELRFVDVRVPANHLVLGEGRGFEIAQGRLGPGRVHHCMRSIGAAERAFELMCQRLSTRVAFGRLVAEQSVWHERIAQARCEIDMARLLTLQAADRIDRKGAKAARKEVAMIKVVAPRVASRVIDWAIQAHGGAGVSADTPLAGMYAGQRTLRLADGPDEVHQQAIARMELRPYATGTRTREADA